mgnify:CR=1 FL=1
MAGPGTRVTRARLRNSGPPETATLAARRWLATQHWEITSVLAHAATRKCRVFASLFNCRVLRISLARRLVRRLVRSKQVNYTNSNLNLNINLILFYKYK